MMNKITIVGATDIGSVRAQNEDHIFWSVRPTSEMSYAVLCDGMGGYAGGAQASQTAVETIKYSLESDIQIKDYQNTSIRLQNALHQANEKIFTLNGQAGTSMGTTAVVVAASTNGLTVGHIGDSRGYLWNASGLHRLTRDHNLLEDSPYPSPSDMNVSQPANILTRALGVYEDIEPEYKQVDISEHCIVLLCSDGLTKYISDGEIDEFMRSCNHLEQVCYAMIDLANSRGGADNISVLTMEILV